MINLYTGRYWSADREISVSLSLPRIVNFPAWLPLQYMFVVAGMFAVVYNHVSCRGSCMWGLNYIDFSNIPIAVIKEDLQRLRMLGPN